MCRVQTVSVRVPVAMVQVRIVRMGVDQWCVAMAVAVGFAHRAIGFMSMLMMRKRCPQATAIHGMSWPTAFAG